MFIFWDNRLLNIVPFSQRFLAVVVLLLSFGGPVIASPLEDAAAAYLRHDYATALRLIRPLAEESVADAQYNLGLMYDMGQGVPQNDAEALKWYGLAAKQGNARAQASLLFRHGREHGRSSKKPTAHESEKK
jgi:TPR repeat protein